MGLLRLKLLQFLKVMKMKPPTKLPKKKIKAIRGLVPHRVGNQSMSHTRAQGPGIHGGVMTPGAMVLGDLMTLIGPWKLQRSYQT
jgi:hypothetical protein